MSEQPAESEGSDPLDAARAALARARLSARDKGFRPGGPLRRSRKAADLGTGRARTEGRDPGVLGDQLDRLLVDRGWKVDVAAGSVQARWEQIVGPTVAEHCTVGSFADGVLVVHAESTAWRTQLEYLESSLLAKIESDIGPDVVTSIRVVGPQAPSWAKGRLRTQGGRGPRDTYG